MAINRQWIGTMRNDVAAKALCDMMEGLAAVPPEKMGWEPLEVVDRAKRRVDEVLAGEPAPAPDTP